MIERRGNRSQSPSASSIIPSKYNSVGVTLLRLQNFEKQAILLYKVERCGLNLLRFLAFFFELPKVEFYRNAVRRKQNNHARTLSFRINFERSVFFVLLESVPIRRTYHDWKVCIRGDVLQVHIEKRLMTVMIFSARYFLRIDLEIECGSTWDDFVAGRL